MIIVSESSAEATQPVRTGRYAPTRRRSSAARSDIPRYGGARLIRVHTEEVHFCGLSLTRLPIVRVTALESMALRVAAR
jgi:hypothetical protein